MTPKFEKMMLIKMIVFFLLWLYLKSVEGGPIVVDGIIRQKPTQQLKENQWQSLSWLDFSIREKFCNVKDSNPLKIMSNLYFSVENKSMKDYLENFTPKMVREKSNCYWLHTDVAAINGNYRCVRLIGKYFLLTVTVRKEDELVRTNCYTHVEYCEKLMLEDSELTKENCSIVAVDNEMNWEDSFINLGVMTEDVNVEKGDHPTTTRQKTVNNIKTLLTETTSLANLKKLKKIIYANQFTVKYTDGLSDQDEKKFKSALQLIDDRIISTVKEINLIWGVIKVRKHGLMASKLDMSMKTTETNVILSKHLQEFEDCFKDKTCSILGMVIMLGESDYAGVSKEILKTIKTVGKQEERYMPGHQFELIKKLNETVENLRRKDELEKIRVEEALEKLSDMNKKYKALFRSTSIDSEKKETELKKKDEQIKKVVQDTEVAEMKSKLERKNLKDKIVNLQNKILNKTEIITTKNEELSGLRIALSESVSTLKKLKFELSKQKTESRVLKKNYEELKKHNVEQDLTETILKQQKEEAERKRKELEKVIEETKRQVKLLEEEKEKELEKRKKEESEKLERERLENERINKEKLEVELEKKRKLEKEKQQREEEEENKRLERNRREANEKENKETTSKPVDPQVGKPEVTDKDKRSEFKNVEREVFCEGDSCLLPSDTVSGNFNCEKITETSNTCVWLMSSALGIGEEVKGDKAKPSRRLKMKFDRRNPCTGDDCLANAKYLDAIETVGTSCETGGIVMLDKFVKSLNDGVGLTLSYHFSRAFFKMSFTQKMICTATPCRIDIDIRRDGAYFTFTSSGPVTIDIQFADGHYTDVTSEKTNLQKRFNMPSFGNLHYKARCNQVIIEKTQVFTKKEWCLSQAGWLGSFNYVWCMNDNYIFYPLILFAVIIFIYFTRRFTAFVISMIICSLASPISMALGAAFIKRCRNCDCILTCRDPKKHLCLKNCSFCEEVISETNDHMDKCTTRNNWQSVAGPLTRLIQNTEILATRMVNLGPGFLIFIMFIVFFRMVSKVEMTELNDDMNGLVHTGFSAYKARFNGENYQRQTVTVINERQTCVSDVCKVTSNVQFILTLEPGLQSGFYITHDKKSYSLDVRVMQTYTTTRMEFLYKSCESDLLSSSGDTCSKNCDVCKSSLLTVPNDRSVGNISQSDTSKWACNSWDCWSINQGCTCGSCWHEAKNKDCYDVYKLVSEVKSFEVCVSVMNKGYCRNITDKTAVVDPDYHFVFLSSMNSWKDKIITTRKGMTLTGPINQKGSFGMKFGAIQYDKLFKANCKPEPIANENCFFGHHRTYTFQKCCSDTWDFYKDLKAIPNSVTDYKSEKFIVKEEKVGVAQVYLKITDMVVARQVGVQLTSASVSECHGCFNCEQGAVLELKIVASAQGLIDVKCDGFVVTQQHLEVKQSTLDYRVYGKANYEDAEISCSIDKIVAKTICKFKKGETNFHSSGSTGVRSIEIQESMCADTMCSVSEEFKKMFYWLADFSWKGIIIKLVIAGFVCLVLIIIVTKVRAWWKGNNNSLDVESIPTIDLQNFAQYVKSLNSKSAVKMPALKKSV